MAEVTGNPLVSVVIPVYNGERWIERCLSSVTAQTYANLEIIVVDDGSKDRSGEICDDVASSDERVRVFHQSNGGVNAARRKGVANATGEWLMFVDADDCIPEHCIEIFLSLIGDGVTVIASARTDEVIGGDSYCMKLLSGEIAPAPWGKLFEMKHFRENQPHLERELVMGEDLILNLVIGRYAEKIVCTSQNLYDVNLQNAQSVTRVFKHTWEYEKYYFDKMFSYVVDGYKGTEMYDKVLFHVRKSQLNGIKYTMLDGNKITYTDEEFKALEYYFKDKRNLLGKSERLVFDVKNTFFYRVILKSYIWLLDTFHEVNFCD